MALEKKRNGTYQFISRGNTIIKIVYLLFTVNKVIREKQLDIDKNDKSNKIASSSIRRLFLIAVKQNNNTIGKTTRCRSKTNKVFRKK